MHSQSKDQNHATQRVAIQGVAGCYHHAAADDYFSECEISPVECTTFDEMFRLLDDRGDIPGIVAIENTIAGALLQNHELLRSSQLRIVGEKKMRISHVAAALPGCGFDQLNEVNSHPMALMQCARFLERHPQLRVVEKFDTAGSARDIAAHHLDTHMAICGEFAARLYGLDILERGIETNKRNFTRFLVVAPEPLIDSLRPDESEINKSSIVFNVPHTRGALSKVLTIFSFYDINLTKIQSMPILGREWEYRFYVDLEFDSYQRYRQSLDAVMPLVGECKILGEYKSCVNEV